MIYLEYDDGHNEPIIYSYESIAEVVRRIIRVRPTMEAGRYNGPYKDGHPAFKTAENWLKRDQYDWDRDNAAILSLFDERSDNYQGEVYISCDSYRWVDADSIEARAEDAHRSAEAMRKGYVV